MNKGVPFLPVLKSDQGYTHFKKSIKPILMELIGDQNDDISDVASDCYSTAQRYKFMPTVFAERVNVEIRRVNAMLNCYEDRKVQFYSKLLTNIV